jgi:hypothetical protein
MQTPRTLAFLAVICLCLGLTAATSSDSKTTALDTITADGIAAHVKVLASDEYEGRMPATRGEEKTLAYITGQLRSFGISPQPNGSYLQDVPLVKKTIQPDATHLVVRRREETTLALGENMSAKTRAGQSST